jgi:hypothetical protein
MNKTYIRKRKTKSTCVTQEFIESFGFIKTRSCDNIEEYQINKNGHKMELINNNGKYSFGIVSAISFNYSAVFSEYFCKTQSELRFLLTKGRIDCSK